MAETSAVPCVRIPGGRTDDVEKGTEEVVAVTLVLLLLREGAEGEEKFWDIPGGGKTETNDVE